MGVIASFTIVAATTSQAVITSFAQVAEQSMPGVVNIRTTIYKANQDPSLDLYQFFLRGKIPTSASSHSVGSGVIIDKQGHILTNYHVISEATSINVLLIDKRKVQAKIVGTDPKTDLALLKIKPAGNMRPLTPGNSDKIRVGDVVLAIGNPFGYGHTVVSGIISAKGRVIGTGPYDNFLQTDAPIHPGNSGGPLLDVRGRLIGINTAVSNEGPGIGFAIPINMAKSIMKDLLKFGKVRRPYLGIVGKSILSRDEIDQTAAASGVYGVIVSNLIVNGPAHHAGLKIGDLIMGFGKKKVEDLYHLQRLMGGKAPADQVRLKIYRRGKGFHHVNVALKELPKTEDLPIEKDLF
jgi:serine protease Do